MTLAPLTPKTVPKRSRWTKPGHIAGTNRRQTNRLKESEFYGQKRYKHNKRQQMPRCHCLLPLMVPFFLTWGKPGSSRRRAIAGYKARKVTQRASPARRHFDWLPRPPRVVLLPSVWQSVVAVQAVFGHAVLTAATQGSVLGIPREPPLAEVYAHLNKPTIERLGVGNEIFAGLETFIRWDRGQPARRSRCLCSAGVGDSRAIRRYLRFRVAACTLTRFRRNSCRR